jgi:hypothetical protein
VKKLKQVSLLPAALAMLVFFICFGRGSNSSDNFQHQPSIDQLASLADDDFDELTQPDQYSIVNDLPVCCWVVNTVDLHKPFAIASAPARVSPLPFYLQASTLRI